MIKELQNIITFLEENEQFGDDWQAEIAVLKKLYCHYKSEEEKDSV